MATNVASLQADMAAGGVDVLGPLVGSDTTDQLPFGQFFRFIIVQTAGAISVTTVNGNVRTIPSGLLALGVIHAFPFRRLMATGTAATVWGIP